MKKTRDSIANIWGERTPYQGKWPVRVDEQTEEEPEKWVYSTCVLCSNGCGLEIGVKDNKIVGVRGRATDRVNHGRLGPKGLNGWIANNSKDRLTKPLIRKKGKLEEASWDEAMDLIVQKSKELKEKHTAASIGFYTTGQLFLEEYYTQAIIGKAGVGTSHMDGNTRLCTATAGASLAQSFGSIGNPGSYTDFDSTEAILHIGHNIASQQTVLWMRILDRLAGPNPPKMVVIDPRRTFTSEKADVHLAPRLGTNLPLMNGLINLIIEAGQVDQAFIEANTMGFEDLKSTVAKWSPDRVEEVTGVPAEKLRTAAEILGNARSMVSTVLQGVYQSMQGTATAVQVNNMHLIRGMIGRPGCNVFQMNGQPSAENTHECGADGEMPGLRNWNNPSHVDELARLWNVEKDTIPHWVPPTDVMHIFKYAEQGVIRMLWISATNPAVSLPDLPRIRKILEKDDLFVIVQDAFLTETAQRADVVLPAAIWGEKTGCFTNVDRTVHISHKAIDPPGEAKSDLDIFLDYARRMDFRDKDGAPLVKWKTPEEVFEAWKICSKGRPCDYSGMSYDKLSSGSGIQWPCNEEYPEGKAHLYSDGIFHTDGEYCQSYGNDIETGAEIPRNTYMGKDPRGKAQIKAADYSPPHEHPDEDYPLWLTTGRLVYHFQTRTKTGQSKALHEAAPDSFVQISTEDAAQYEIAEGDIIEVKSRRGRVFVPARIGNIEQGTTFVPFHYGYWDEQDGRKRAANELTLTQWDPVSKQPHYKYAAVRISKADTSALGKLIAGAKEEVADVKQKVVTTLRDKFKM